MSDIVIKVENLSKRYIIGHQKQERYTALRDVISDKVRGIGNIFNFRSQQKDEAFEDFWALKDVSFEIKQGDRVGIIGRNGAGKSTLLKILSRITEPTSGKISIKGRVASLLEVGTGFHPELTGRENIYLNGAILGMDRYEIKKKFDEIVDFAEVEKFLDTPVKRYSSGMYVRLAFAVAAHLEPEILIVDEVLAVGDAQFQKKCLGKMEDVAHKEGRTVIFVSHNMGAIKSLCHNCIWLESGILKVYGSTQSVVSDYMNLSINFDGSNQISPNQHIKGNANIIIEKVTVLNTEGLVQSAFLIGETFGINLTYKVHFSSECSFWIFVSSVEGNVIFSSFQKDVSPPVLISENGTMSVYIDSIKLLPGTYLLSAGIFGKTDIIDWLDGVARFEILPQFQDGQPFDHRYGIFTQDCKWNLVSPKNEKYM